MNKVAVIGLVGDSAFLSLDRFPNDGETLSATAYHREWGGKGANQAIAAARMGAAVSFLGAVGNDGSADKVRAFLATENITATIVEKIGATPFAAILTDKTAQNRVTVYGGVALDEADVHAFAHHIENADILLLSNELPPKVNLAAASIAKESGTKIIFNPAPPRPLESDFADKVWLFTPNEHERDSIGSRKNAVVTLGSKGCHLLASDTRLSAYPVTAVDTTGAGDAFNGALAACLAHDRPLYDSVVTASAAAAVSVTRRYAATAMPNLEEVKEFLSADKAFGKRKTRRLI